MAELNYAEKMNIGYENEYSTDAMTGGSDKRRQLYYQLIQSMKKAESVDIIVSFLMESGVKMLLQELENTLKRGAKIRILTGNYLGITQPSALYLIKRKLGDRADLRFYCEKDRSFHPKSYIFHYADHSELYIGSSNISRSALTSGIEWNYRFSSKKDPENYAEFFHTFEDLFENHSIIIDDKELKRYSQNWHRPAVAKDLDKYDFEQEAENTKIKRMYEPRGAQIEALCALEDTRAEGAKKGLIQAATGIGKTYLAAFDSKPYEKVLFVAHREEILKQAADSFRNVRNSEDYGFFTGDEKCTDKSVIFASVATLGKSEYLNEKYFVPDYFDYVVIDEFHHAVNDQYRKIVEYFKPQFLLGLTATPERMDGKNIYEICDYNVPYEISLKDGINKGMLVPFHYYGIYDETDYTKLHIVRGKYAEEELNKTYIGNAYRHDLIYKYYCKYGSKQALGFTNQVARIMLSSIILPPVIKISVQVNKLCRAICGHILAAKNFYDNECLTENKLRKYVLCEEELPPYNMSLLYWTYPYSTIAIMRDICVYPNYNKYEFPKGVISIMNAFPVAYIISTDKEKCGLFDLFSICSKDINEIIEVPVDCSSCYFPETKHLRPFAWPCNISDDEDGAVFMLGVDKCMDDSKLARHSVENINKIRSKKY